MAREDATRASIDAFLRELGRRFAGRGALYLAGGSMPVSARARLTSTTASNSQPVTIRSSFKPSAQRNGP